MQAVTLLLPTLASSAVLTLHVKAGPDGRAYGDCPFAHAVRMALEYKELEYNLAPHAPNAKPEWLMKDYGGAMPCLEDGSTKVTDSSAICTYLEKQYPKPTLSPPGLDAAEAVRSPVFSAFARYCKNVDANADDELKKALLLALCKLDAHLEKQASPFAAGASFSRCDCFLLPALYHIKVAGAEFKGFEIPSQYEALQKYIEEMFESDLLYRTVRAFKCHEP